MVDECLVGRSGIPDALSHRPRGISPLKKRANRVCGPRRRSRASLSSGEQDPKIVLDSANHAVVKEIVASGDAAFGWGQLGSGRLAIVDDVNVVYSWTGRGVIVHLREGQVVWQNLTSRSRDLFDDGVSLSLPQTVQTSDMIVLCSAWLAVGFTIPIDDFTIHLQGDDLECAARSVACMLEQKLEIDSVAVLVGRVDAASATSS